MLIFDFFHSEPDPLLMATKEYEGYMLLREANHTPNCPKGDRF
ncbi:MAG: hypothetical protein AB4063_17165 [Crocosphaera sp.]